MKGLITKNLILFKIFSFFIFKKSKKGQTRACLTFLVEIHMLFSCRFCWNDQMNGSLHS